MDEDSPAIIGCALTNRVLLKIGPVVAVSTVMMGDFPPPLEDEEELLAASVLVELPSASSTMHSLVDCTAGLAELGRGAGFAEIGVSTVLVGGSVLPPEDEEELLAASVSLGLSSASSTMASLVDCTADLIGLRRGAVFAGIGCGPVL